MLFLTVYVQADIWDYIKNESLNFRAESKVKEHVLNNFDSSLYRITTTYCNLFLSSIYILYYTFNSIILRHGSNLRICTKNLTKRKWRKFSI